MRNNYDPNPVWTAVNVGGGLPTEAAPQELEGVSALRSAVNSCINSPAAGAASVLYRPTATDHVICRVSGFLQVGSIVELFSIPFTINTAVIEYYYRSRSYCNRVWSAIGIILSSVCLWRCALWLSGSVYGRPPRTPLWSLRRSPRSPIVGWGRGHPLPIPFPLRP